MGQRSRRMRQERARAEVERNRREKNAMEAKTLSFITSMTLILGGLTACALGVFAPPAAIAGAQLVGAGMLSFTAGVAALSASKSGPTAKDDSKKDDAT